MQRNSGRSDRSFCLNLRSQVIGGCRSDQPFELPPLQFPGYGLVLGVPPERGADVFLATGDDADNDSPPRHAQASRQRDDDRRDHRAPRFFDFDSRAASHTFARSRL
jgi:hypothetical protein